MLGNGVLTGCAVNERIQGRRNAPWACAAQAVSGRGFRLMDPRGVWHTLPDGTRAFATVHPARVLRLMGDQRAEGYANFLSDLRLLGCNE